MVDIRSPATPAAFLHPHGTDFNPASDPMDSKNHGSPGEDSDSESESSPIAAAPASGGEEVDDQTKISKRGLLQYGCSHYKRRCKLRAPCCNKIFDCRHCHNEAMSEDHKTAHQLPRHKVRSVICSLCGVEQEVHQICSNCGVCMGEYFCPKCNFFDDDTTKAQYHCDKCGICRVGGQDKYFHCDRCACCYSITLRSAHSCVENSMHQNCPVCFEFLFDSVADITVMPCGHTIHSACLDAMYQHSQYTCPVCSKSIGDMTAMWIQMDQEVASTPMPEEYRAKLVWILCNDCSAITRVPFHVVGQKCNSCGSYNTRQTKSGPSSSHHQQQQQEPQSQSQIQSQSHS